MKILKKIVCIIFVCVLCSALIFRPVKTRADGFAIGSDLLAALFVGITSSLFGVTYNTGAYADQDSFYSAVRDFFGLNMVNNNSSGEAYLTSTGNIYLAGTIVSDMISKFSSKVNQLDQANEITTSGSTREFYIVPNPNTIYNTTDKKVAQIVNIYGNKNIWRNYNFLANNGTPYLSKSNTASYQWVNLSGSIGSSLPFCTPINLRYLKNGVFLDSFTWTLDQYRNYYFTKTGTHTINIGSNTYILCDYTVKFYDTSNNLVSITKVPLGKLDKYYVCPIILFGQTSNSNGSISVNDQRTFYPLLYPMMYPINEENIVYPCMDFNYWLSYVAPYVKIGTSGEPIVNYLNSSADYFRWYYSMNYQSTVGSVELTNSYSALQTYFRNNSVSVSGSGQVLVVGGVKNNFVGATNAINDGIVIDTGNSYTVDDVAVSFPQDIYEDYVDSFSHVVVTDKPITNDIPVDTSKDVTMDLTTDYIGSADSTTSADVPSDYPIHLGDAFIADALNTFFPFCIPYDFYSVIKVFNAAPVAWSIDEDIPIQFGSNQVATIPLEIDLADYADWFLAIRIFLFIAAVIGLIFITRNLIRG